LNELNGNAEDSESEIELNDRESKDDSVPSILETDSFKVDSVPSILETDSFIVDYKNITKVKCSDEFAVPNTFHRLGRIAFKNENIYISDYEDRSIKLINMKEDEIRTIENEKILRPYSLCISTNGNMYVDNLDGNKIIVLDNNMKYKDEFETSLKVANIGFDRFENKIYIADWLNNKISIYDENKRHESVTNEVDSPLFMDFSKNYVFVISKTEYTIDPLNHRLIKITKGSNCIFILDKKEKIPMIKKISFDYWLAPAGLYVDLNGNMVTTALKLHENSKSISKNRYLFVISQSGDVLREIELVDVADKFNSMAFDGLKLIISHDKSFNRIEFD
jgi:DNA-binding beta-propeller fold protein YncE